MTPKLQNIYKLAKNDEGFCKAMKEADGCFVPSFVASETTKIAFSAMYSGWLLCALGVDAYNKLSATL